MNFITKCWKGILLCLVIAVPCWFLGQTFPIIGGPVFGILAGMIITLLLKDKSMFQDGITFVSKKVLQYAVILLGFGLNLSVILETGKQSLPIIVTTISTSLIIAYLLHKVMHLFDLHPKPEEARHCGDQRRRLRAEHDVQRAHRLAVAAAQIDLVLDRRAVLIR